MKIFADQEPIGIKDSNSQTSIFQGLGIFARDGFEIFLHFRSRIIPIYVEKKEFIDPNSEN